MNGVWIIICKEKEKSNLRSMKPVAEKDKKGIRTQNPTNLSGWNIGQFSHMYFSLY